MDDPARKSQARPRPTFSRRRRWFFRLIALCIPLLPLLVGETICRFFGYGGYPPVLRALGTNQGKTYYGSNQPGLSTFFFQNLTIPGSMEEQVFTMPKRPGTVRVFILGESAARGFPQPRNLAASSFFQAMLEDVWDDRQPEVLNLGTTALASFPLMYIAREVLRLDPDLVIVYAGNNEFYGAHGVTSVHSFGQSTLAMKTFRFLRRFALVQWFTDVRTRGRQDEGDTGRARTLMERVIAESQIAPDDPCRAAAARNLENHLTGVVEQCRARGVPVLVCTLPSNERDLAPIGQDLAPTLPADQRRRFDDLLKQGQSLLADDPAAALESLREAERLWKKNAALQFTIGRCLTALGQHQEALTYYVEAQDLDTMPWRAPAACNDSVRRAADAGAALCDLQAVFRRNSPGGAIGWELMDDHVHPALAGQALIARTWLHAMTRLPGPLHVDPARVERLPGDEAYAGRLGANLYDRYGVAHRMRSLLEAPFYRRNNEAALHRFEAICAEYESRMSPPVLDASRRWQDPHIHRGGLRPIAGMVGQALMGAGDYAAADPLLTVARNQVPPYSVWNLEFTWSALQCRRHLRTAPLPEDLALARELLEHGETFRRVTGITPPAMRSYLGLTYNLLDQHERAIEHLGEAVRYVQGPEGLEVVQALVDSLLKTHQRDRAIHLLQMPVRDPQLREACRAMLDALNAQSGRTARESSGS